MSEELAVQTDLLNESAAPIESEVGESQTQIERAEPVSGSGQQKPVAVSDDGKVPVDAAQLQELMALRQQFEQSQRMRQAYEEDQREQARQAAEIESLIKEEREIQRMAELGDIQGAIRLRRQVEANRAAQVAEQVFQRNISRMMAPVKAQKFIESHPQLQDIREASTVIADMERAFQAGQVTEQDMIAWVRQIKQAALESAKPKPKGRRGGYMEGVDDAETNMSPQEEDRWAKNLWEGIL